MGNHFYKIVLWIAVLFASHFSFAQLPVPFKVRYQSYVKGDMTVIANNIVNRKDIGNTPNDPYMNASKTARLNDEYEMFYVDIDKDITTFSSSSAVLYLENVHQKKIVYAGLYWAATYKYTSGERTKGGKFKAVDKKRDDFKQIKLKLPGNNSYVDVVGTVIFDGYNKKDFDESAPYAVYADVTEWVSSLENPSGEYTIANIKATQGKIEGGVAGGWTLFFVYEDEAGKDKFITSFDGFAGVTDKPTEILYTGFKTLPSGNVFAKLAFASLEGDVNLLGDQLQIKGKYSTEFTLLNTKLKPENNFFNSAITIDDVYFTQRTPNSKNTLGYDTGLITVDNPSNSIIQNNSDEVSLKLKTIGDRYFMFFNAFNVEVLEIPRTDVVITSNDKVKVDNIKPNIIEKQIISPKKEVVERIDNSTSNPLKENNPKEIITNVVTPKKEIANANEINTSPTIKNARRPNITIAKQDVPKTTQPVINHPKVTSKPDVIATNQNLNPMDISEKMHTLARNKFGRDLKALIEPGPIVQMTNVNQGFYIIAGVFAVPSNAEKFLSKLRSMGLDANYFINPKNNYRYIYISKHDNWSSALSLHYSSMNGKYFGDTWIMPINVSENQYVINYPTIINLNPFCPQQNSVITKSDEDLV